ncbi:hypothetical protein [Nonomuraea pusilla]|uniref:PknH-like extracellular domain-containing protein n=1 Tax=Nonomuraea pusilla TaxID=46177 RepID=A0A1H7VF75_9ACTN|nr:hypothetical protein [Nonomuraea pusilla]SEM07585.1 hypothetical protein SAMN05660976_04113 [Nonomuraea pusilla]
MRTALRPIVAACVAATALAGGAHAAEAATKIPTGFLTYENASARSAVEFGETRWKVSDARTAQLLVNPCGARKTADAGRVAARTVTSSGDNDAGNDEQLVLYRSEALARQAMKGIRDALATCKGASDAARTVRRGQAASIGDEALRVIVQSTLAEGPGGGERSVVARRGSALIIYRVHTTYDPAKTGFRRADFKRQEKDAKALAGKVCGLPGVC